MEKFSNHKPFLYSIPMALNILKGKKEYSMELLERATDSDQVSYLDLDYWVIFDYIDEPRFLQIRDNLESKVKIAWSFLQFS